jgi:Tfp pilus assembly protein PilF
MGQEQQATIWIDKALQIAPKNAKALEMKKEILESMKK